MVESGWTVGTGGSGILKASHGVAAWKLVEPALYTFIHDWWPFRAIPGKVGILRRLERRTSFDCPRATVFHALLDGLGLDLHVPAILKIAMIAISRCVTVGKDEEATVGDVDIIDVI